MTKQIDRVMKVIETLMNRKFWGKLELTFREGRITLVKQEETTRFDE